MGFGLWKFHCSTTGALTLLLAVFLMAEKLTQQLTAKVSETMFDTFNRLACVEGLSSADLVRNLIDQYIQKKHEEFILLSKAFAVQGNPDNKENQ